MSLTLYRPMPMSYMLDRLYDAELARSRAAAPRYLPVDVIATENDYVIRAVVPGLKPEELNVEIEGSTVTLRGEIKGPETGQGQYLLHEVGYGKFVRVLEIETDLNGAKAEAHVENGLLTLRIPKAETAKPKVVKVLAR